MIVTFRAFARAAAVVKLARPYGIGISPVACWKNVVKAGSHACYGHGTACIQEKVCSKYHNAAAAQQGGLCACCCGCLDEQLG